MAAVIATVLDIAWAAATPSQWLSSQRGAYAGVESNAAEWARIKEAIAERLRRQLWSPSQGRQPRQRPRPQPQPPWRPQAAE